MSLPPCSAVNYMGIYTLRMSNSITKLFVNDSNTVVLLVGRDRRQLENRIVHQSISVKPVVNCRHVTDHLNTKLCVVVTGSLCNINCGVCGYWLRIFKKSWWVLQLRTGPRSAIKALLLLYWNYFTREFHLRMASLSLRCSFLSQFPFVFLLFICHAWKQLSSLYYKEKA